MGQAGHDGHRSLAGGREPGGLGPGTYIFPEDKGQDGRRELRQEDDQDEQEELQREGQARESRGRAGGKGTCSRSSPPPVTRLT